MGKNYKGIVSEYTGDIILVGIVTTRNPNGIAARLRNTANKIDKETTPIKSQ